VYKISEKIREARLEKGMTQEQLAKALDVKPNKISQWENSYIEPSVDWIRKIAVALQCDPNYLLGFGE